MNRISTQVEVPVSESIAAARAARLRYVSDGQPGFTRKRRGRNFAYYDAHGALLKDKEQLKRIQALVIPPAWTQVWISPFANGHIQATGRDARGRKQYRYHARWSALRNETKFERMIPFGEALPRLRSRVEQDLRSPGLSRNKVLATIVRLLETTLIRVGNEEYARTNASFGLTTLRNEHVEVEGSTIHFRFKGKSGIEHSINLRDPRLARIVKACQELPEQDLFEYLDDEQAVHRISSTDVNAYLQELTGEEFTAKSFRTWAGTLCAALALKDLEPPSAAEQRKKSHAQVIKLVSRYLGNTPAVCRKYYVHPAVFDAHATGKLASFFPVSAGAAPEVEAELIVPSAATSSGRLSASEKAVLEFLRAALKS